MKRFSSFESVGWDPPVDIYPKDSAPIRFAWFNFLD